MKAPLQVRSNWKQTYSLLDPVASGSFAAVYKAFHIPSSKTVAIKMLPYPRQDVSTVKLDAMIERERTNWAHLTRNAVPTIPRLIECFREHEGGTAYFVQDYVQGVTLDDPAVQRELRTSPWLAQSFVRALSYALSMCHVWKVCHGDLKPSNIMVSIHDKGDILVKLVDFGSSHALKSEDARVHAMHVFSTPAYAAPEVIQAGCMSLAADMWSFSCIVHELMPEWASEDPMMRACLHMAPEKRPSIQAMQAYLEYGSRGPIDF
jgi:eukaryotic-like serine/threonine-protein kinase